MKKAIIILCSLVLVLTSCNNSDNKKQEADNTSDNGKDVKDFVPANWTIIKQASGDLNADNIDDVAIVVQATDKKNIAISADDTIDMNPRSLIILFKDPTSNGYKLITKNDSCIRSIDTTMGMTVKLFNRNDMFDIAIQKGNLKLHYQHIRDNETYLFRYQNNDFALIGIENSSVTGGTGETYNLSVNFLTKKYSETTGSIDPKVKPKTEWKNFQLKTLKTLTTYNSPDMWNFLH